MGLPDLRGGADPSSNANALANNANELFMRSTFLSAIALAFLGVTTFAAQPLTGDEQTFIQKVASGDQAEIQLSKIALERASIPEIKQFAQTMVTDHTKASSM